MTDSDTCPESMRLLSRRHLLSLAVAGASLNGLSPMKVWGNSTPPMSEGKLVVTLQLDGGVDVTMFCDPKLNVLGEPKINHWADRLEPQQTVGIRYAPVALNESLFERFGPDMLVINGVDCQTNSHDTGKLFNWTGSNAEGRPSLSALHAAFNSPQEPLAYSVFGGLSRTAGIVGYNRFDDLSVMRRLSQPNTDEWSGETRRLPQELRQSQQLLQSNLEQLMSQPSLSVRDRQSLIRYKAARENRESLARLADLIPEEQDLMRWDEFDAGGMNFSSNLRQQMQSALLVFKSGLGTAADLSLGGFDSHDENEPIQEALMMHLYQALDFFWDYAESLDLAHRILLVIGSDFGRTNFINDGNGKDHWPIGSYILMERGAAWGGRTLGVTDDLHFAMPVDPGNLRPDRGGIVLTPAHIHKALREYLGLEGFAQNLLISDAGIESLPLFDPEIDSAH